MISLPTMSSITAPVIVISVAVSSLDNWAPSSLRSVLPGDSSALQCGSLGEFALQSNAPTLQTCLCLSMCNLLAKLLSVLHGLCQVVDVLLQTVQSTLSLELSAASPFVMQNSLRFADHSPSGCDIFCSQRCGTNLQITGACFVDDPSRWMLLLDPCKVNHHAQNR